jgi:hypothetical protein
MLLCSRGFVNVVAACNQTVNTVRVRYVRTHRPAVMCVREYQRHVAGAATVRLTLG